MSEIKPVTLKPCPFCGAPAEIDTHRGFRHISTGAMESAVSIYCSKHCQIEMMFPVRDYDGSRDDLAFMLSEQWNQRPALPAEKVLEIAEHFDAATEAARILGETQAKKAFGCYTETDGRTERAMHESISKHRAAIREALEGHHG
jgi:hypothetical protein